MSKRDTIKKVFVTLRRKGFIARMNYKCCSGCAGAAIAESKPAEGTPVVFWHRQDEQSAFIEGRGKLMLRFGAFDGDNAATTKVGEQIVAELKSAGLDYEWDGTPHHCIAVLIGDDWG